VNVTLSTRTPGERIRKARAMSFGPRTVTRSGSPEAPRIVSGTSMSTSQFSGPVSSPSSSTISSPASAAATAAEMLGYAVLGTVRTSAIADA